jgi:hypothetical protein
MLLKLNNQYSLILYHDINGNLIGKINEQIYWLDINKDSKLEFIKLENPDSLYNVENGKINYNKITNIPQDSLKKKLINSITDNDENYLPEELEDDAFEIVRFLKNRLLYLKTIKWGYSWNDETLPR